MVEESTYTERPSECEYVLANLPPSLPQIFIGRYDARRAKRRREIILDEIVLFCVLVIGCNVVIHAFSGPAQLTSLLTSWGYNDGSGRPVGAGASLSGEAVAQRVLWSGLGAQLLAILVFVKYARPALERSATLRHPLASAGPSATPLASAAPSATLRHPPRECCCASHWLHCPFRSVTLALRFMRVPVRRYVFSRTTTALEANPFEQACLVYT